MFDKRIYQHSHQPNRAVFYVLAQRLPHGAHTPGTPRWGKQGPFSPVLVPEAIHSVRNKSAMKNWEWSKWNESSEVEWRAELSHQRSDSVLKGCGVNESGQESVWTGPAGVLWWPSTGIDSWHLDSSHTWLSHHPPICLWENHITAQGLHTL